MRNPIAKALRSSHLRQQVLPDKKKVLKRANVRSKLKKGKYDDS